MSRPRRRLRSRSLFDAAVNEVAPALADGCSVEDEVAAREVEQLLGAAMARLEPAHREVLLLRDVQRYTAPEAAVQPGLSVAALKSRLHRARAALRDAVRELVPELEPRLEV